MGRFGNIKISKKSMIHIKNDDPSSDFTIEVVIYVAISVIFFMVIAMMMKLLWDTSNEDNVIGMRVSETSGLLSQNVEAWSIALYGTNEDDTKSNSDKSCTSSSDDLYDGKICVLCYDDQRSCLFMPCGHFITCYTCAKRYGEHIKNSIMK
ncbi:E3 ubiquitin-protein ligase RNF34-like isoform X2 [Salvia hispanica]|uniref:E3 ubiquitin-protein ligase RNF34-like isoform X2 n=1 Tax=Salvia hispanica TaxID=49212 RepID=UPI002009BCF7|nr:E3 ubiquitin-protein ligase RNF34-like isoform X2 [Salvia hispanica]